MRLLLLILALASPLLAVDGLQQLHDLPISGNQRFPTQQLRRAALGNGGLLLASVPGTKPAVLQAAMAAALQRGYRSHGHPDVQITVEPEAGLVIKEGPLLRCGDVLLPEPLPEALTSLLRDALLLPYRDEDGQPQAAAQNLEDPVWNRDRDAPFHQGGLQNCENRALWALRQLGHLQATVSCELIRRDDAGLADLQLRIEAGPVQTLEEIHIDGLQRHSREQILTYLELGVGVPLTAKLARNTATALRDSGCFRHVRVILPTEAPWVLRVELLEHPDLPQLGEALDPVRARLLQLRQQLLQDLQDGRGLLAELEWQGATLRWQIKPEQGMLLTIAYHDQSWQLLLRDGQAALRLANKQVQAAVPMRSIVGVQLLSTAEGEQNRTLNLTAAAVLADEHDAPLTLDLVIEAAALLYTDFIEGLQYEQGDQQHILRREGLEIHCADGLLTRLEANQPPLRFQLRMSDTELPPLPAANQRVSGLGFVASLGEAGRQIWTSMGAQQLPPATNAVLASIAKQAWQLLAQDFAAAPAETDESTFSIPTPSSSGQAMQILQMAQALLPSLHLLSTDVLPVEHWLPTVLRNGYRLLAGRNEGLSDELRRLYNDPACGPIGTATLASLLPFLDANLGELFAERLTTVRNAKAFRAEWTDLTRHHPERWLRAGEILLSLDGIADLADVIDDEFRRELVRSQIKAMQQSYQETGTLPKDGWWEIAWQLFGMPMVELMAEP